MKRLLAILALTALTAGLAVFGMGSGDGGSYLVRAEFRNAFSLIPGLDVKIAGVKVGSIDSLDVTPRQTAAVVLRIDKPGFQDFRQDATCTIRPQSLIGEKFVECTPTQPKPQGAAQSPKLERISSGDGEGQYRLPGFQAKVVDLDLINNTLRLPYRQRLSLILNELGAGLAGRGEDLDKIIRDADPGLKATDKVLGILADQNRVLANLARDSDTIMAPLSRERDKVADFVVQANTTAQATAERSRDLEANLERLPKFLSELKPTMVRLGSLSDEFTPLLADLGSVAPDVSRFIKELGPFSTAATPAVEALGDTSVVGRDALLGSRPIIEDLREFATQARPLSTNLEALLTSFKETGGIERLMDYLFYQVAAINGFDAFGHYLRAQLIVNLCSTYAVTNDPACSANFTGNEARSASSRSAQSALDSIDEGRSPNLAKQDAVLRGMSVDEVLERTGERKKAEPALAPIKQDTSDAQAPLKLPSQFLPAPANQGTATGAAGPKETAPAPGSGDPTTDSLLDYLLGGG
ncbi:MlaD family protein [Paraconexibacter sp.]|uniref:MlaD family protein n=1 Tax=Paraconexibacter sp. TaxID=2949640 RepID=UPI00356802AA